MPSTVLKYGTGENASTATYTNFPKAPSTLKDNFNMLTTESNRTVATGTMYKELIGMKRKIECTWYYMLPNEYARLQVMFENQNFFCISMISPKTSAIINSSQVQANTLKMVVYGSDLTAEAVRADGETGQILAWKNVSWNFIER